jgi:hypothetical protein
MEREYARYIMVRELIDIGRDSYWGRFIESVMLNMAHETIPRTDPVCITMTLDHKSLKYLDTFMSYGYTKQEIDDLKFKTLTSINQFLKQDHSTTNDMINLQICTHTVRLSYKDYYHVMHIDTYNMLKLLHIGTEQELPYNLIRSLLRYASVVSETTQYNLHTKYFEVLYELGYKYELASPLNFILGMIEYRKKLQTGKPFTIESRFHSMFPDVDAPFQCKDRVFISNFTPISYTVYHIPYSEASIELSRTLAASQVQNIAYITKFNLDLQDFKKLMIKSPVYEVCNKYAYPYEFAFSQLYIYYRGPDMYMPKLELSPSDSILLRKEWQRYLIAKGLLSIYTGTPNEQYELIKIVYKFMTNMASQSTYITDTLEYVIADPIFCNLERSHKIYKDLEADLYEKKLPEYIADNWHNMILRYFRQNIHKVGVTYWIRKDHIFISSHDQHIRINISPLAFHTLIEHQANNNQVSFDRIVIAARYNTLTMGHKSLAHPANQFYTKLYLDYNCNIEAFTNPINSKLMILDFILDKHNSRYCSLFADTDQELGSLGSFFDLVPANESSIYIEPPFISDIINKIPAKLLDMFTDKTKKLIVITLLPINNIDHLDPSNYKQITSHPNTVYTSIVSIKPTHNDYVYLPKQEFLYAVITNNPKYISLDHASLLSKLL